MVYLIQYFKSPGKLTDDEYDDIKNHPSIGAKIIAPAKIFDPIIPIVKHHHERFDGRGYPSKLKGNDIPYLARITAVADAFDAMTSRRSYRDSLDLDVVKEEIRKNSGTQFDPEIAKVFLSLFDTEPQEIERIMVRRSEGRRRKSVNRCRIYIKN